MRKFIFIIFAICFSIYNLQVSNNDPSNPAQEYNNGFNDGYNTCFANYNLTKDPVDPDRIFAFTLAYGLFFKDNNRKKGYADGYCHATNELCKIK